MCKIELKSRYKLSVCIFGDGWFSTTSKHRSNIRGYLLVNHLNKKATPMTSELNLFA
jgi:hypothetical protein